MNDIAANGVDFTATINYQEWHVAWHPPPDPPSGATEEFLAETVVQAEVMRIGRWGR